MTSESREAVGVLPAPPAGLWQREGSGGPPAPDKNRTNPFLSSADFDRTRRGRGVGREVCPENRAVVPRRPPIAGHLTIRAGRRRLTRTFRGSRGVSA